MRDFETVVEGFEQVLRGLGVADTLHTKDTGRRAAKAWWNELCAGLTQEPPVLTAFKSDANEMIISRKIPVLSMCAHHLLPFVGTATVAYVPGTGKILGLSKLSRLTDYHARRLQVQEELTNQIADALAKIVVRKGDGAGGVGVVIRANHFCMQMRGVKHEGDMVTSALRGVFTAPEVRAEFLKLAGV